MIHENIADYELWRRKSPFPPGLIAKLGSPGLIGQKLNERVKWKKSLKLTDKGSKGQGKIVLVFTSPEVLLSTLRCYSVANIYKVVRVTSSFRRCQYCINVSISKRGKALHRCTLQREEQ